MTEPARFDVRGVCVGPPGARILDDVTVPIPTDGVTVLAGPSGAGKSTLLRLLNRLDEPSVGTIEFGGRELTDWDPQQLRRRVAMVFQRPPVFDGTVLDNFRVALADVTEERARHVMEHVELPVELLHREADRLSGGEAQRMCMARALLTGPEVVLADEPTAALDRDHRLALEDLARQLADEGTSVVWVSHDTDQLRRIADHVVVLVEGRLAGFGHLHELDASSDEVVRRAIGADA